MLLLTRPKIALAATIILLLAALTVGGLVLAATPSTLGTVVLDAGHGGWDNGVTGPITGIHEADINLQIVYLLRDELRARNFTVVLTRRGNRALGDTKKHDMAARRRIIEQARPNLVISIHMNKYKGDSGRRGAQVFYDNTGIGRETAYVMQSTLNKHLNAVYAGRSNISALAGDFFIAKAFPTPSLIIECGFLGSSAEDERLLTSNEYQRTLARIIAGGTAEIFTKLAIAT